MLRILLSFCLSLFGPVALAQQDETGLTAEQAEFAASLAYASALGDSCDERSRPNLEMVDAMLLEMGYVIDYESVDEPFFDELRRVQETIDLSDEIYGSDQACDNLRARYGEEGTIIPGLAIFAE